MEAKSPKRIISTNPVITQPQFNVNFEVNKFNDAINRKGYNIYHEKALRCPCVNRGSGEALPSCNNCAGIGHFYVEKTKTKALIQNFHSVKKAESWSETNPGTVNVTVKAEDDVTYYDRLTVIDLQTNFSQVVYPLQFQDKILSYLVYEPTKVFSVYKFNTDSTPLDKLYSIKERSVDWDYEVVRNILFLNPEKFSDIEDLSISIRYKHHPVYHIFDLTREVFEVDSKDNCDDMEGIRKMMPMRCVAKRAHYLPHANNLTGERVFDNTDYTKFNANSIRF